MRSPASHFFRLAAMGAVLLVAPSTAPSDDWIVQSNLITGELIAQTDSTLLIQSADQRQWLVRRDDVREHHPTKILPTTFDRETLAKLLAEQFPQHKILNTEHYLICQDLNSDHARQAARLLEQVYRAYFEFCLDLKLNASEPRHPLVVLLFDDAQDFSRNMDRELGVSTANVVAFYHLASNRISVRAGADQTAFLAEYVVAPKLPLDARTTLATHLVHEATHQLMCNSGIQSRLANYPLWVSEGIAAYFEPADAFARNGWRRPGGLNSIRFAQLKQLLKSTTPIDLRAMIRSDDSFRKAAVSGESYSLAWGFNHFLFKRRNNEYSAYLRQLSKKQPLATDTPDQRMNEFQSFFDEDISTLEREFAEYISGF